MNRLVLFTATAAFAAGLVAVPAIAGLSGNPSFSRRLPVPVPTQARAVELVGNDLTVAPNTARLTTPHPKATDNNGTSDTRGPSNEAEPGDGASAIETEPGKDATPSAKPSDDVGAKPSAGNDESGRDRSGGGGHG